MVGFMVVGKRVGLSVVGMGVGCGVVGATVGTNDTMASLIFRFLLLECRLNIHQE